MIEEIAQPLFKAVISVLRIIILDLTIFRPIYWFGWIFLKVLSFGYFPERGINQPDLESIYIEYLTWIIGLILTSILIFFSFSFSFS